MVRVLVVTRGQDRRYRIERRTLSRSHLVGDGNIIRRRDAGKGHRRSQLEEYSDDLRTL